jgi:DNA-binding CsgD family transcriptional regulator
MQMSDAIGDYARNLARDCDIDSTVAFIADKTTSGTRLFYLGNYGVQDEVLDTYQVHRICDVDPFTDTLINEADSVGDARFRVPNQPEIARCGARAHDYWRFVSHRDIEVVGASTLRLQSRLYLTIGAHRSARRKRRAGVPTERLGHQIGVLRDKIATNLLSSLLTSGAGYRSLVSLFAPPADKAAPNLSARETDIARLVCEGRQNKEIAWLASLSEYTVENHLRRIYQKLGIHNRAALVARMNHLVV